MAGLQQTGPGFSEPGHHRGAFRSIRCLTKPVCSLVNLSAVLLIGVVLFSLVCVLKDLACFEKQWGSFFSSMDQESHLSILELSEAQAGEVGPILQITSTFSQPR